ncbi:uncharacterized protein LOC131859050 [Cryptomeria japonica]|uniref:uncharacterized protein LOC131859050 n=1 Tax=Cryptomeria japonica TaxID=3369 RepID=UPI0027DA1867|nr:uncharacterized protein LOC131859050 [Cryptomeria japonica]
MEVTKQNKEPIFDLIDHLKHVCVKIPLFQAIKDVPIYNKANKEAYLKKPGRKKKDPQTVHLVGQIVDIILGKVTVPNYSNPSSPVVGIVINGIHVQNALIDLGVAINVMKKDVMQHLNITTLIPTPIVLQLADSSTVKLDGMVEDLVVTLYSWEYLADFMILSLKETLRGDPIILGRPWLATIDASIRCRSGDMIISNGMTAKKLVLYPLTKPQLDLTQPMWPNIGEETDEDNSVAQLMVIDKDPFLQLQEEDEILSNILQNHYGAVEQPD